MESDFCMGGVMKRINELKQRGVRHKEHAIVIGPVGCGLLFVTSWLFAAIGLIGTMVHCDPVIGARLDFFHWPNGAGSCGLVACAAVFTFLHWRFSGASEK